MNMTTRRSRCCRRYGRRLRHNHDSVNIPPPENRVRGSFEGAFGGRSGVIQGSFRIVRGLFFRAFFDRLLFKKS